MSLIVIGKIGFAVAGTAFSSIGLVALTKLLTYADVEIYGFLDTTTLGSKSKDGVKNFECKIPNFDTFECSVREVEKLDKNASSKNHVSLDKIIETKDVELAPEQLDKTKFYKITIAESVFNTPTATNAQQQNQSTPTASWKSIEVFGKTGSSPSNLGTINVLSVIKSGSALTLGEWKTKHFVGQASAPLDPKTEYKCTWKQDETELRACSIKPFVADDDATNQKEDAKITDLTFTKDANLSSSKKITQHNYYLIEFKDDSDAKEKASFTESEMVYLKEGNEEKVTFKKLSAVKLIGDQLLIIQQQKTTS